ncbi:hypothetical protein MSAS_17370 [Mycobacterium saskatchewanense]|uniref:Mammalian cell entry protein n=1 Tax=Mycobacterium saskatchewanense TaxID=220927 RepID=A0AAJ3NS95_9MYCO|nr:hypothetical protein [Mycobacterium saskatchewanense]ORW72910.1 hypothetical protein AWC23_08620 [Mycobacterium saskatchewanense]BBX62563.1 hypothetical protein MSAS_17370 [Mycobacterium saskatchewanense]
MADDAVAADRELGAPTDTDDSGQDADHRDAGTDSFGAEAEADAVDQGPPARRMTGFRTTVAVGLAAIVALGIVAGWLSVSAHRLHQREEQGAEFLRVGRQGALNLTTISYADADSAVQRILDISTGAFRDDFKKRSGPFLDVVKQTQSITEGTVTEAALESMQNDHAQVLLAVSVRTTSPAQPPQEPHLWRMRITVQKGGDGAKMSDVAFVP